MALVSDAFPRCCGITIINSFPFKGGDYGAATKSEIDTVKKELETKVRNTTTGLALVALSQHQDKAFGETVEECGFRKLTENFYSNIHGNCITLYGLAKQGENHEIPVTGVFNKLACAFPQWGSKGRDNYW